MKLAHLPELFQSGLCGQSLLKPAGRVTVTFGPYGDGTMQRIPKICGTTVNN